MGRSPSLPPPAPFVVGYGRSGTTLLRLMLDAHPDLAIPPETGFVPRLIRACRDSRAGVPEIEALLAAERNWADFGLAPEDVTERLAGLRRITPAQAVRAFFGAYAARVGKSRWGDKTPRYGSRMPMIASAVPEARFVHLLRDGRDVALSWRNFRLVRGDRPVPLEQLARDWHDTIRSTREKSRRIPHYTEVRYEDLVTEPRGVVERVCEFIQLPFDPAVLEHHRHAAERLSEVARELPATGRQPSRSPGDRTAPHELATKPPTPERAGAWREEMSEAEQGEFEGVAGPLLAELGYEVGIESRLRGG